MLWATWTHDPIKVYCSGTGEDVRKFIERLPREFEESKDHREEVEDYNYNEN